jgi:hypothetical protein
VVPAENRTYADRQTQAAYEAYRAGTAEFARLITESKLETQALRDKVRALAVAK